MRDLISMIIHTQEKVNCTRFLYNCAFFRYKKNDLFLLTLHICSDIFFLEDFDVSSRAVYQLVYRRYDILRTLLMQRFAERNVIFFFSSRLCLYNFAQYDTQWWYRFSDCNAILHRCINCCMLPIIAELSISFARVNWFDKLYNKVFVCAVQQVLIT